MISLFNLLTLLLLFFNVPLSPASTLPPEEPEIKLMHSIEETDEYLPWFSERRLNWDDFLCEPKRNTDAVALTSTALGIAYKVSGGQLTYEITCSFSKTKSWGLLKTPYILAHEQGHFDITEIYARKLHKELSEYQFNRRTFKLDVSAIYDRIVKQKENFQYAYDGQSDHSRNKGLQLEWLHRINTLLEETAPYAEYP
ncbi:MAG TPA: DUF922 domain-containing protein [Chitinophagaceae bacterium]|nr:DUF922 domain-containing protein [Chitinophagaceae bacterium]